MCCEWCLTSPPQVSSVRNSWNNSCFSLRNQADLFEVIWKKKKKTHHAAYPAGSSHPGFPVWMCSCFHSFLVSHTFICVCFSALVASTSTLFSFFPLRNPRALSHSFFSSSLSSSAVLVVRGAWPPPPPPSPEEQAERASGQSAHAASHELHEARPLARVSVRATATTTACVQCVFLVRGRPCEHCPSPQRGGGVWVGRVG